MTDLETQLRRVLRERADDIDTDPITLLALLRYRVTLNTDNRLMSDTSMTRSSASLFIPAYDSSGHPTTPTRPPAPATRATSWWITCPRCGPLRCR